MAHFVAFLINLNKPNVTIYKGKTFVFIKLQIIEQIRQKFNYGRKIYRLD